MNAKELRSKSDSELAQILLELRRAQFSLRMQIASEQLANNGKISKLRKDIARTKTVQRERMFNK